MFQSRILIFPILKPSLIPQVTRESFENRASFFLCGSRVYLSVYTHLSHGQMDHISQTSSVDTQQLFLACAGRIACTIATRVLQHVRQKTELKLERKIRRWHAQRSFEARARLDLPTFSLQTTQAALSMLPTDSYSMMWQALRTTIEMFGHGVRVVTQTAALVDVLRGHGEEQLLTWMTLGVELLTLVPYLKSSSNFGKFGE